MGIIMKSMTKAELIAALDFAEDDDEIFVQVSSGDHWRTQLAQPIRDVSDGTITWSNYHEQYKISDESRPESDPDHPNKYVILL